AAAGGSSELFDFRGLARPPIATGIPTPIPGSPRRTGTAAPSGKGVYHSRRRDGLPLAFAGLWDRGDGPAGPLLSCSIVTTTANELVNPVPDRMPRIRGPEASAPWLDPAARPKA